MDGRGKKRAGRGGVGVDRLVTSEVLNEDGGGTEGSAALRLPLGMLGDHTHLPASDFSRTEL